MLASITPLGERSRRHRWWVTYAWYLAGSVAGGVTIGVLAGGAGASLTRVVGRSDTATAVAVLLVGLVAVAFERPGSGARLPTVVRQVDEDWIGRYRAWQYAGGFGYQLGLGVVTLVTTAAVYLTWVLAVVSGSLAAGAVIGLSFGFARALPLLAVADVDSPAALRRRVAAFHRVGPAATRAAFVAVVAVPVVATIAFAGAV
jgi:sulfite exporter TauE/SafE